MVELFRWVTGQLSEEDYKDIKGRLGEFCKKEIQFIRELQFTMPSDSGMQEQFRIIMNRLDGENIYLMKTREGNGCLMQSTEKITKTEFYFIINGDYEALKESDNELLIELAWHMELDECAVKGIVEYIQEKYIKESTIEEYTIKSLMVGIKESAERFFDNDLTASKDVDYDMKQLEYMKKIHMPVMINNVV